MDLYTTRLHIRPVNILDNERIFKYRSDPETHRFLSLFPETVEDVSAFIGRTSNEINIPGTWFQFVVIERRSDTLIGDIGIHFLETDSENMQAEIGYTLDKN